MSIWPTRIKRDSYHVSGITRWSITIGMKLDTADTTYLVRATCSQCCGSKESVAGIYSRCFTISLQSLMHCCVRNCYSSYGTFCWSGLRVPAIFMNDNKYPTVQSIPIVWDKQDSQMGLLFTQVQHFYR